jgi:hypothetical protein
MCSSIFDENSNISESQIWDNKLERLTNCHPKSNAMLMDSVVLSEREMAVQWLVVSPR